MIPYTYEIVKQLKDMTILKVYVSKQLIGQISVHTDGKVCYSALGNINNLSSIRRAAETYYRL